MDELLNELSICFDKDTVDKIVSGYVNKYVTIRINNLKASDLEVFSYLDNNNITYEKVSFYDKALVLKNVTNEEIMNSELFKEGKIYLQSLSSILPPLFMDLKEDSNILDMTASPGSKLSEIQALSNNKTLITGVERNKERFERLKYNVDHLGCKKVTLLNMDARDLNDFMKFDEILLDVPCSGSGTVTNKDDVKNFGSILEHSIKTQKVLIDKALKLLKPNGTLIYSTCSLLDKEDEDIIRSILSDEYKLEPINIDGILNYESKLEGTIKVLPNEYFEGFYIAKIKKVK